MEDNQKVILVILDGFGLRPDPYYNAIIEAKTPVIDTLSEKTKMIALNASGESVGLPWGEMGNSEVGHINLGSGRVVLSDYTQINNTIQNRSFYSNPVFRDAIITLKKTEGNFHIVGIISDGGIHGHIDHIIAGAKLAAEAGLEPIIHAITDGRDSAPKAATKFISRIEKELEKIGRGKIATIGGRYFFMDRDRRWDRTLLAYQAMVEGKGNKSESIQDAISDAYKSGKSDEFIKPTIIGEYIPITPKDCVFFTNYRSDRAVQLSKMFTDKRFDEVKRKSILGVNFISMTEYEHGIGTKVLFNVVNLNNPKSNPLSNPLAEVISNNKLNQFHAGESEKKAHVTYFFNAGNEKPFPGEDVLIVPSPKVNTYDKAPEMSAENLCTRFLNNIKSHNFAFSLINFANPDMVGHTGVFKATVKAIETVDDQIGKIVKFCRENKINLIITADHGNAEIIRDHESPSVNKEHSTNPVPLYMIPILKLEELGEFEVASKDIKLKHHSLKPIGLLADVAPTILSILNIKQPSEMTGQSLWSMVNGK